MSDYYRLLFAFSGVLGCHLYHPDAMSCLALLACSLLASIGTPDILGVFALIATFWIVLASVLLGRVIEAAPCRPDPTLVSVSFRAPPQQ